MHGTGGWNVTPDSDRIRDMSDPNVITRLLQDAALGSRAAADELLPVVYQELRVLADSQLRKLVPGQTLQPTALVHEAYLRLLNKAVTTFENRRHFFFAAARAIKDILVEQARRKGAAKRGGDFRRVDATQITAAFEASPDDLIMLCDLLRELEEKFPRKHQLIMLRFFAGLTESECAELLAVDRRTVARDWRFARAWLFNRIESGSRPS